MQYDQALYPLSHLYSTHSAVTALVVYEVGPKMTRKITEV